MSGHVLILGGARSGKTGFAERMAMRSGNTPLYLATAQALDAEMTERVKLHQQQRKIQAEIKALDGNMAFMTSLAAVAQLGALALDRLAPAHDLESLEKIVPDLVP